MPQKTQTKKDQEYIKKFLNIDPLCWARYQDGSLAVIAESGQKFKFSADQLKQIEVKAAAAARAAKKPAAKKPAASASRSKSKTAKK